MQENAPESYKAPIEEFDFVHQVHTKNRLKIYLLKLATPGCFLLIPPFTYKSCLLARLRNEQPDAGHDQVGNVGSKQS